jgi:hypothetical protein
LVISRRAAAIATSSGIIDQEYLDETLEPDRRQQIPDALWRAIRAPRGGRRGLSTKVRHIREGIDQGFYKGNYPFVTREGLEYARQWKFQVCDSVLQGATVWEIETSSSEEEVQILERPAAKARPTPKASEPVPVLGKPAAKARPTSKVPEPSESPGRLHLGNIIGIVIFCCATGKTKWNTSVESSCKAISEGNRENLEA